MEGSRSRALAFASHIPPPRVRRTWQSDQPPSEASARRRAERREVRVPLEGPKPRELTELEALEALHDDMRRKVQAARTSF